MKTFLIAIITLLVSILIVVDIFQEPSLLTLHHRGVALIFQHKFPAAERVFERLVSLCPEDSIPWFNLGVAQLNQADQGVDRAMVSLERAAELDPDNPRIPYSI